jgi:DNA polymerase-4
MNRTILHVDMDAFYASVEQFDHPEWRGKPVIVGAPPDQRGVVAAASYEARKFGVRSAMPSRTAGRLCPHGIFTPPNMKRYEEVSAQVFAIFDRFTPLVEPLSVDEAFLDVTGARHLFGDGEAIARKIKAAIRQKVGFTASVGVAPNKFLAKIASEMNKPDGLTLVPFEPDAIAAFLAPLPVEKVWGVGKVTAEALQKKGLHTIGDLQKASLSLLTQNLGRAGAESLHELAWGRDDREVETGNEAKSISREHTFLEDERDAAVIEAVLNELADDVGAQLRAAGIYAGVGRLKFRWQDFTTLTRQKAFACKVCDDSSLREMARSLFRAITLDRPVRLVGFGVTHLGGKQTEQLGLFSGPSKTLEKKEALSRAVDNIRRQFGKKSLRRGEVDL